MILATHNAYMPCRGASLRAAVACVGVVPVLSPISPVAMHIKRATWLGFGPEELPI